jgi:aconitate hydratase
MKDFFGTHSTIESGTGPVFFYSLEKLEKSGMAGISRLPYSVKILLESALRCCDDLTITTRDVETLASWRKSVSPEKEIPFKPGRVLLQDFTGVPALVDLAAMRSAVQRMGGDPKTIEPLIPCDLVIDHSIQVDFHGQSDALRQNMHMEMLRNRERYEFLKWGRQAFKKFRIIPPGMGIIHQINLEYLATGILTETMDNRQFIYPDTVVGTDSHTTTINGLGVLGWGVGGIEAEAVMLGQPIYMLMPQIVGFKLYGQVPPGVTATDIALSVTHLLRQKGVVGTFVEFYGPGATAMSLPDRATVANMAPEYGATMALFPMDDESLDYLRRTGRPEHLVNLVERYYKEQGLFNCMTNEQPDYHVNLELDLGTIEPCLAGPKRPQDQIKLSSAKKSFRESLQAPVQKSGFQIPAEQINRSVTIKINDQDLAISHGSVVIASITSCTNTSNPSVMLAAGLVAKKAEERGLKVPAFVKTSLSPGSRVVTEYLQKCGLQPFLDALGFYTVGYGCMTCIGNSGPLPEALSSAVEGNNLIVAAVLSGNRNFEGRIHPLVKANYLASPPLVVAYALAGTMQIDFAGDPLGHDGQGRPVFLKDIWPDQQEIAALMETANLSETYQNVYSLLDESNPEWQNIPVHQGDLYEWDIHSSYIQQPPYFDKFKTHTGTIQPIEQARILLMLGDSVTTDHISPAGSIHNASPAAEFLRANGIHHQDFNTYGARRGNDKVMARGTFAHSRLVNLLLPNQEGFNTLHLPERASMSIYDAAMLYKAQETPVIIIAGKEYGTGSSRDWAAKGPALLGVRAVLAESFERIHRSNLVGMGILPLQFMKGQSASSLGLTGFEKYDIAVHDKIRPGDEIIVQVEKADGRRHAFSMILRLDTPVDVKYYRNGGILLTVLRDILKM